MPNTPPFTVQPYEDCFKFIPFAGLGFGLQVGPIFFSPTSQAQSLVNPASPDLHTYICVLLVASSHFLRREYFDSHWHSAAWRETGRKKYESLNPNNLVKNTRNENGSYNFYTRFCLQFKYVNGQYHKFNDKK